MASWTEIERIRKDADGARRTAGQLFKLYEKDLTPWEATFLESLELKTYLDELSLRQAEKLLEIRDDLEWVKSHRGLSVARLICGCHQARLDLNEDDEAWIEEVFEVSPTSIRKRDLRRLVRCARELGVIDDE